MALPSDLRNQTAPMPKQPQVIAALWRGRFTIALWVCIAALVGSVYVFGLATPKYASTARLAMQARNQQVVDLESVISGVSTEDEAINTELRILKSRALVGQLVAEMNLVDDPEFNPFLAQPSSISMPGILQVASAFLGIDLPKDEPPSSVQIRNKTVKQVTKAINVASVRDTYLFDITAKTRDPEKSANVANSVAANFVWI